MITVQQPAGPVQIAMLTNNEDGTIDVRLHPGTLSGPRGVTLREPTALEYAECRSMMRDADRRLDEEFPPTPVPTIPADTADAAATAIFQKYATDRATQLRDRQDTVRDPEKAPYAHCLISVIERLSGETVTLGDLPVEAFQPLTCAALLEAWEAPLGGPAVPPAAPAVDAVPEVVPAPSLPAATAPDSPAPEGS